MNKWSQYFPNRFKVDWKAQLEALCIESDAARLLRQEMLEIQARLGGPDERSDDQAEVARIAHALNNILCGKVLESSKVASSAMPIQQKIGSLRLELSLEQAALRRTTEYFANAMKAGLNKESSSLQMIPSFLSAPTGSEVGTALAVDFGGSNLRVMEVKLDGNRGALPQAVNSFALVNPSAGYDYTSESADAPALFGFIGQKISELPPSKPQMPLGCTFSFPCNQTSVVEAKLIKWTKEFKTRGTEGRDVGELLSDGLSKTGLSKVKVRAIANDTVATLLAASYQQQDVDISVILGTGHNSSYIEPRHPLTQGSMIVNIESGNFDGAPASRFDAMLDEQSSNRGSQRLEKMVSGRYLGEIIRYIMLDLSRDGFLPGTQAFEERQLIRGRDIDLILLDTGTLASIAKFGRDRIGVQLTHEQCKAVQAIVQIVVQRSASLVATIIVGILRHIDPTLKRLHTVAIDGSLYEKTPGYATILQQVLSGLVGDKNCVRIVLKKDGSGIGAALAAIMAENV